MRKGVIFLSKSLRSRTRMTVFSPAMLLSILAGLFLLLWVHVRSYIGYANHHGWTKASLNIAYVFLDDIYMAQSLNVYCLFSPILAVLPAAAVFCDDYNSGYIRAILVRADKKRYARECLICSTISGGLALLIPCLIVTLLFIAGGHLNTGSAWNHSGYSTVFDSTVYSRIQYIWGGIFLAVLLLVLAFLFGAFWSNAGLAISAFFPNKYAVLAAPFALYFAQHLFLYKSDTLVVFSMNNIMMPAGEFISYAAFPFVYQTIWLLVVAFVYRWAMGRRLSDV